MPAPAAVVLREARAALIADTALTGAALREALLTTTDRWLADLLGAAPGVALVALGGYGRGEPAFGSDLDLLLLHRKGADATTVAESLWYPIWDTGVGLDHSVRTVEEALAVARADLKAMVGMLDARHVAGDAELSGELHRGAFALWRRDLRRRLPELVAAVAARAARAGELAFLLEPDLKECRGGLRDVTTIAAVAAAQVADGPDERVRAAHTWLLDVRGELHRRRLASGSRGSRAVDRLVAQEQAPIAEALGVAGADELMRRVSEAGRTISYAVDASSRRASAAAAPSRRRVRRLAGIRRPLADGVVEQDGEVHLARGADPAADPGLVLRVAAAAAQASLPVADHTMRRLAEETPPMPHPWPPSARDALVATLGAGRPGVLVMEALDQAGLLVRLLPEWERVRCLPQHNPVHQFTVDRHLVETAAQAATLTRQVGRPDLLLLGALLHDIGKGFPGDHTEAGVAVVPDIGRRMGLRPADVAVLTALVRHHLLLPDTATRRDLADPATVDTVVAAVGDRETLALLHALTEADAVATGPAAWNDWKAGLVRELVNRAAGALAGRPPPEPDPLDDGQLALAAAGALGLEVAGSRITVVAPDRPGLLWRWAAVLAVHRLEVRSAVATTAPGSGTPMAVTVFDAAPRFGSPPDVDALRADVRRAYDDPWPFAAHLADRERWYVERAATAPAPPRVLWVDGASHTATVVEVRAHDVLGLLYRLTFALSEAGLDVRSARITTIGAEVVDTFYVVDATGSSLTDRRRRDDLERVLVAACEVPRADESR